FSSRRRHTRLQGDWSSDVCSSDLEAVPAGKCEHRPDPISKSAIELARHIAVAENRFLETVINGVFDASASALPDTVKTPQEVAAWYEQRFAKNFDALARLSGDQLV